MSKSILITGCSSGIGYDAAHTLAKRGWRVFATCRAEEDCARLRDEGLESFQLDYADEASIKTAVAEVIARTGGTLDALYNNGAYAMPGAVEDISRDALRAVFEVNFFGQFDLINQVAPIMRAQGHGRIINCSSILGLVVQRWKGAYSGTKFAVEGMTDALRMEMRPSNIRVILIVPGPIDTTIRIKSQQYFEKWVDVDASPFVTEYQTTLIDRLYADRDTNEAHQSQPPAVTQKLIHALEAKRPKPRYFVTSATYGADIMRRLLPTWATDVILSRG